MNIETIKEFVDNLIKKSPLSSNSKVEIQHSSYENTVHITIQNIRYFANFSIKSNKTFELRIYDYFDYKQLIDIKASFNKLDDLQTKWYETEILFGKEQIPPSDHVKYPIMRLWILESLESLADVEYQKCAWINGKYPEGIYDDFTMVVNILFDDTQVSEEPKSHIRVILKNEEEAQAIGKVTQAIEHLLNKLGNNVPDIEYLKDPDWIYIVNSSKEALKVFKAE